MISHAMESWKGFRSFAMLSLTSNELAATNGIVFRSSYDDLDEIRESAFSGKSGTVYGLVEHVHSPVPGVEILAHETSLRDGSLWPTLDALDGLEIGQDKVRWSLPSTSTEEKPTRTVYLAGHELTRFEPKFLRTIRSVVQDEGYQVVAPWLDLIGESPRREHLRALQASSLVIYLTSTLDEWTFYELGFARALYKPVLALEYGAKRVAGLQENRPKFDQEIRIPQTQDLTELRLALRNMITLYLAQLTRK